MVPTLKAGAAEVDITPPPGLPLDGYADRKGGSAGVHDPLMGQVLILDDGSVRLVIAALDVLAVSAGFADHLRQSLATLCETSPQAVMLCASHTHCGPAGLQDWFPIGSAPVLNDDLLQAIHEQIMAVAQIALYRLTEARLVYGGTEITGLSGDRNQPQQPVDSRVTALRLEDLTGVPLAIVFHYACHPTVLSAKTQVYSADFPGAARRTIQKQYPSAIALYLNGAAGNISTRFFRRDQSFDEMTRIGTALGAKVIQALEKPERTTAELAFACQVDDLPLRSFPSSQQRHIQTTGDRRIDETRSQGAAIETQLRQAFVGHEAVKAVLCILYMGPWKLFFVPGEAFSEMALTLRAADPFGLVVGYANDYVGYFPTQAAMDAETYEALSSPYDARAHQHIQNTVLRKLNAQ